MQQKTDGLLCYRRNLTTNLGKKPTADDVWTHVSIKTLKLHQFASEHVVNLEKKTKRKSAVTSLYLQTSRSGSEISSVWNESVWYCWDAKQMRALCSEPDAATPAKCWWNHWLSTTEAFALSCLPAKSVAGKTNCGEKRQHILPQNLLVLLGSPRLVSY